VGKVNESKKNGCISRDNIFSTIHLLVLKSVIYHDFVLKDTSTKIYKLFSLIYERYETILKIL